MIVFLPRLIFCIGWFVGSNIYHDITILNWRRVVHNHNLFHNQLVIAAVTFPIFLFSLYTTTTLRIHSTVKRRRCKKSETKSPSGPWKWSTRTFLICKKWKIAKLLKTGYNEHTGRKIIFLPCWKVLFCWKLRQPMRGIFSSNGTCED